MKLPIKKKYFDEIKSGNKIYEYRDSHITFVCEETGETLTKDVNDVFMRKINSLPVLDDCRELFDDEVVLIFRLGEYKNTERSL